MELNSKESITIKFKLEDEEHIVPKNILDKSKKIRKLLEEQGDSQPLQIESIASETFFMLVHYLNGLKVHRTDEEVQKMIEAAKHLELTDDTLKLQKLAERIFPKKP